MTPQGYRRLLRRNLDPVFGKTKLRHTTRIEAADGIEPSYRALQALA